MATEAQQIADSGENEDLEKPAIEQPAEGSQQEPETPPEVASLAQKMGWVPRDQFDGPSDAWKPADQFILDGRDIQRETSRELKAVRATLDTVARTSASLVEQRAQERAQELMRQHQQAVDDGDQKQAFEIAKEITSLTAEKPPQPAPEVQEWVQRNSGWFRQPGHEYATARAVEITNLLAGQGITDYAQQLKIAEQRLRVEKLIPDAPQPRKPPAGVNSPGSRSSGSSGRQKGFSDMPVEAQKIARDMADRGVIKDVNDYAKNYFANEQAKG